MIISANWKNELKELKLNLDIIKRSNYEDWYNRTGLCWNCYQSWF